MRFTEEDGSAVYMGCVVAKLVKKDDLHESWHIV